jgi:hypothetical protein
MIAFTVDVQNGHTEGFWCPHEEWEAKRIGRFDRLSDAICAAMPLVGKNDDVIVSIVTFDHDKPGHTTTEAMYDFLHGTLRHAARKAA